MGCSLQLAMSSEPGSLEKQNPSTGSPNDATEQGFENVYQDSSTGGILQRCLYLL